ncbi:MAG: histidine transporter permease HisQ [Sedimenticola sp.]|nr:MAG: histidine transporter permease HisQ [Sedimenticola sp.]
MTPEESVLTLLSLGDAGWGDELLRGALLTIEIALVSLAIGLVLGLATAGAKISHSWLLKALASTYTNIIRGIPEFLIILLVFFGSDQLMISLGNWLNYDGLFEINKFVAGVLALSLIFGAYASEVFRGAYLAVPYGQIEAALACGMTPMGAFWRIRMPQMWRYAIPGLGNLWMVLLKDTSLVSVIALDELLRQSNIAGETTREPFMFYLAAALIYLLFTIVSDYGRHRMELRANRGVRRV